MVHQTEVYELQKSVSSTAAIMRLHVYVIVIIINYYTFLICLTSVSELSWVLSLLQLRLLLVPKVETVSRLCASRTLFKSLLSTVPSKYNPLW